MNKYLQKLRDCFCYCGLSKEEYKIIKKDAYVSNFTVWKYLHVLMMLGYAVLMVMSMIYEGFSLPYMVHLGMMIYSIVGCILFFFVFREDMLGAQFFIYLSMILLMLSSLLVGINRTDMVSVGFIALLVLLPMFMIDKPYFMAILLSASVAVYLLVEKQYLRPDIFRVDMTNAILCGIVGIIINTFYNYIRIREINMRKQEKELIKREHDANAQMRKLNETLKGMSESVVDLLGDVVESRDKESGEHIRRVKGFSNILAHQVMEDLPEYGLDEYTVDLITYTSSLHDVGKIFIPDSILCKPSKLTDEEFDIMKTHCEKGCLIIRKMADSWSQDYIEMGMTICRSHHEKWDGSGYPDGLKGDNIPIAAQIVSIADIYDALTSERVYKEKYADETAYEMIMSGECGIFSEKLLACLSKCRTRFAEHAADPFALHINERDYELISKRRPGESFVIGLHDQDKTLREKVRLNEELSVLTCLSEEQYYVCYVDMVNNQVLRFKADDCFARIIDGFDKNLGSNEKFDKLLNTVIVPDDYSSFRRATDRATCMKVLTKGGHISTDFRIKLNDGIHYCRMRMSMAPNNPEAVIIGISKRDEEHKLEEEYIKAQTQYEQMRIGMLKTF